MAISTLDSDPTPTGMECVWNDDRTAITVRIYYDAVFAGIHFPVTIENNYAPDSNFDIAGATWLGVLATQLAAIGYELP